MKIKFLIIFLFFLLLSCKSKKEISKLPQKTLTESYKKTINNTVWNQVGPHIPNEDSLNKYSDSTEKYWFGNGQVSAIWNDELNDNHILIGVAFGGLFETFDAGDNWHCLTDKVPVHQIQKIHKKDGVIYISTGYRFKNPLRFSTVRKEFYGLGVISSKDNGKTWHLPEVNFNCDDFSLSNQHKTMYAISWNKVYKSTDSGISFQQVGDFSHQGTENTNDKIMLFNVVVHPSNSNIAYVSGRSATSKNAKLLYKTTDGGLTWLDITSVLEQFIGDTPKKSVGHFIKDVSVFVNKETNKLWVHFSTAFEFSYSGNSEKKYKKLHSYVLSSIDFENFNFEMKQEMRSGTHYSIRIYEKEETLYLIGWYLYIKKPSETQFVNVGSGKVHQDCRAVGVDSNGIIYYGNDAGIYKSNDDGKSWQNTYTQMNANLINEMGYYSNETERRIDIGTQDDGYYRNNMDGTARFPIETHEGGIYTSPHNKDRIYVKDSQLKVSINGGKSFKTLHLNNGKPIKIWHNDAMVMEDPVEKNVLYTAHINDTYRSEKLGEKGSWVKISPKNGNNGRNCDMAIPKSNNNILYLANRLVSFPIKNGAYSTYKTEGHLMKSINKGQTWTKISNSFDLTNTVISDVEVDDDNPNLLWITLRNLVNGEKIYQSDDGGQTWKNISYNLPNVPANRVEYNQQSGLLILANDYGVYYLDGNTWQDYGLDLPKVIITSMVLDYHFNEIVVSTFGRGVWTAELR